MAIENCGGRSTHGGTRWRRVVEGGAEWCSVVLGGLCHTWCR